MDPALSTNAPLIASALKFFFVSIYILFGVFILSMAVEAGPKHRSRILGSAIGAMQSTRSFLASRLSFNTCLSVMALLLLARFAVTGVYLPVAVVALGVALWLALRGPTQPTGTELAPHVAPTFVVTLAWWLVTPDDAFQPELVNFTAIEAGVRLTAFAAIVWAFATGLDEAQRQRAGHPTLLITACLAAGAVLLGDLAAYTHDDFSLYLLAHHWGAYIGSALHIQSGLIPFYDVPLQYGLGPTLAIALACGDDGCWRGAQVVFVLMPLANAYLLLRMALATRQPRGWLWQLTVTGLVFAAVFLWPGNPVVGNGSISVPSVGGVRFFPTTLVAYLLFMGRPRTAGLALVLAVLWSPESGAMALTVFGLVETARTGFFRAAAQTGAILVASLLTLFLVHHALYGVWIEPAALFEYVLHVPGPLPIDIFSNAMLLAAVLALGGWLLLNPSSDAVEARFDLVCVALLLASATYWLGRSHPNNICNLAPFLTLCVLRALDRPTEHACPFARALAFGLAMSTALLAFSPWRTVPFERPMTSDIAQLTGRFAQLDPDLEWVRGQLNNPDSLEVATFGTIQRREVGERGVWTPLAPVSLWAYVPSSRRRLYMQRASEKLRRSGWAVFDDNHLYLLEDLRSVYRTAARYEFSVPDAAARNPSAHYTAVCFDPPVTTDHIASGPQCPKQSMPNSL